jgi:hypothetical protein
MRSKPSNISKISSAIFYSKPERAAVDRGILGGTKNAPFLLGFLGLCGSGL